MASVSQKSPSRAPRSTLRSNNLGASQLRQRHGGGRHQPSSPANQADDPIAQASPGPKLRRGSTFSDTVSEARHSIKSSTDELFLPRVDGRGGGTEQDHESAWQSTPLALALLPALAGIFFHNGTAVFTDLTLLVLAAVFLNWSIRLPWDWYKSAQGVVLSEAPDEFSPLDDIPEDDVVEDGDPVDGSPLSPPAAQANKPKDDDHEHKIDTHPKRTDPENTAARRELQRHELAALTSCFLFPVIGAWLLHTIRAQLSRPSEGLVSNYNLTIFLLAAEIRPFSHLLKLVRARTLHLQRVVASDSTSSSTTLTESTAAYDNKILDLSKRLDEIETHIANSKSQNALEGVTPGSPPPLQANHSSQRRFKGKEPDTEQPSTTDLVAEVRNMIQPDIDALNRAVRRFDRRSAAFSTQTEARFQDLEERVQQSFAAAADRHGRGAYGLDLVLGVLQWISMPLLFPLRFLWAMACLPAQMAAWCFHSLGNVVGRGNLRGTLVTSDT